MEDTANFDRLNNSDLLLLDDWGWNLSHQNSVATCWK
ncbi:hypothetical protein BANRA_01481 [Escherichia coli]|nr:hypothetical protein BANRA_01481 [Escherichia coli]